MTRDLLIRRGLRAAAIAIAVAAALDPVITSKRSDRPDIAVIAVDPQHDSALSTRVARSLGASFTVTTAPFANAGATVLVGDRLPATTTEIGAPVFAVTPDRSGALVTIEDLHAPAWAPLESRVPVTLSQHTSGTMNGEVTVTLRQDGVVVDRATQKINGDDVRSTVPLAFTPTAVGVATLRATATILRSSGRGDSSQVDAAVDIRDARWSVLFYDPRPSWLSTFVRRATEDDRRIAVAGRTMTSRGISTAAGKAPATLDDLSAIDAYDVIVIGAADALTDRDVAALDAFLRKRGGSVILLLDQHSDGPWQRLANAGKWLDNGSGRVVNVAAAPGAAFLKASELAWPAQLPPGAEPIAFSLPPAGDTTGRRPVIWRSPIGAGELIVSGALDSWRYRDSTLSGFDRYWRELIADAAATAAPPVSIGLSNTMAAPGEPIDVKVTVRDATLHALPARTSITAAIGATPIQLWPSGPVGELAATIRAPTVAGIYRAVATAQGVRAEAPLVVATSASHAQPEGRELLATWVTAHGGTVFPASQLGQLATAIRSAVRPTPRREQWHPLRSAWWLLPFALALSAEWWMRRRRGLA